MTIWMCSGQGSQYYQMARGAYEAEPVFRESMRLCSGLLEPMLGLSLVDFIYRERADRFAPFDRTLFANPAICAAQYSAAQVLLARGPRPDAILGYSIGEITAAVLGGTLALEEGLRVAVRLAELAEGSLSEGGMLAVLADPAIVSGRPGLSDGAWIAARNFATHFVVSGAAGVIERLERSLLGDRVPVQRLPVRYAFHTPAIDPIERAFVSYAESLSFSTVRSHEAIRTMSARDGGWTGCLTPQHLWDAVRLPVDFQRTVQELERSGPHSYVDLGPAGTLSNFVKYNLPKSSQSTFRAFVTPFGYAPAAPAGSMR